jgi:hypothetical protein
MLLVIVEDLFDALNAWVVITLVVLPGMLFVPIENLKLGPRPADPARKRAHRSPGRREHGENPERQRLGGAVYLRGLVSTSP